jgi:hypothetical protein
LKTKQKKKMKKKKKKKKKKKMERWWDELEFGSFSFLLFSIFFKSIPLSISLAFLSSF